MEKNIFNKIILIFIIFNLAVIQIGIHAQDSLNNTKPINLADTTFNKDTERILKKILQVVKFRENRNIKEQQRVYQFLLKHVQNHDLNIDSNINDILGVLDSLNRVNGLEKIESIEQKNIDPLKVIAIDSFRLALDAALDSVRNNSMKNYLTKQQQKDSVYRTKLKKLRSITYACKILENRSDSIRQPCLRPKTKIIGWHKFSINNEYKNYNYNYLTAINLYGYELDIDGQAKNPSDLVQLHNSEGVVGLAKEYDTDIYITVYSKSEEDISEFLGNRQAQDKLIHELNELAVTDKIQGVTIFFNTIQKQDALNFVSFIIKLRSEFQENGLTMTMNVTIPAIHNNKSLAHANHYNFQELNVMVDNYIVLTDRMANLNSDWAQAPSPLYSDEISGMGTIESTINFYNNGKIPMDKLVMTVSYQGLSWPVLDVASHGNTEVDSNRSTLLGYIQYKDIVKEYLNNTDGKPELSITQNFDSISAMAYINVIDSIKNFEPQWTQIWYENRLSLEMKYKWLLEKNLAGLSIRGLGYDDGYTELWNVLGASLIEIDYSKDKLSNNQINEIAIEDTSEILDKIIKGLVVFVLLIIGVFILRKKPTK